jgi:CubicO group peptidase (beta-lactamase class C family)
MFYRVANLKQHGSPQHFHAASISILFTAVAIMQLRDEGEAGP